MSENNIDPMETSQFKNGDNIHFDYSNEPIMSTNLNSSTSSSKKKKKKKKNKVKIDPESVHATLNNPHDDYPTSRIIKQAPNGDVIVESMDDQSIDSHNHHHGQNHYHDHPTNIWDNATLEEQENLKSFWESLNEAQKMELVKIDKKSIMEIFKNEAKTTAGQSHNQNGNSQSRNGCSCSYCGRKNDIIEDELENIYDNHFDDIIDFIHEVRDINDLNALPGLLFGGFQMLEEEHKLQKRQQKHRHSQGNELSHNQSKDKDHNFTNTMIEKSISNEVTEFEEYNKNNGKINLSTENDDSTDNQLHTGESINTSNNLNSTASPKVLPDLLQKGEQQKAIQQLLDPKLTEALESFDFEKMKGSANSASLLEKAGSLREMIRGLHKADKAQLEKGMAFLQDMGKVIAGDVNDKLSQGLSSFAEDLLKNDGNSFIDMMECLSESRTEREDLLREGSKSESAWIDEDDRPQIDISCEKLNQLEEYCKENDEINVSVRDVERKINDSDDEEYDNDEDEEEHEVEDEEDDASCDEESYVESEISEEEKMQEIRRLFLIQVIKLFQERLKKAYKEKLSEDRTKKLIEELEAEENAKREKELKKLKQKEKAKEKKRLQQLAKEEERRKKEEEQRLKEEESKKKQEALRAEQKLRKEEARQKREEEKKKRLEELRRKELEQSKKAEAQRKKEEEAKKIKDERKKMVEEERRKKEEEKKQKEFIRKQREEERLRLKERDDYLMKEALKKEVIENENIDLNKSTEVRFPMHVPDVINELSTGLPSITKTEDQNLKSPTKNHLLEQLYLAKPSSLTPATKLVQSPGEYSVNSTPIISSVLSPTPSSVLPNSMLNSSPNKSNSVNNPWGNSSSLNSQPVFQNQFAPQSTFSPFNGYSTNTIPMSTSNGISSSVWNQPASNSNSSIWGNNNASGSLWNNQTNNPSSMISENDLIQAAAYNAFQLLKNSNKLEFDVAPSLTLFQNTKTILSNANLTLNQFLGACRTSALYTFDFIYDNNGTVTHINVGLTSTNPLTRASPPGLISNLPSGSLGHSTESNSLLNGFGDVNNNSFTNIRNLWN